MIFGRDGSRYYQVWQSLKYPRLQVWVFGLIGKPPGRQYRVEDWDPVVETLEEAIQICRAGRKRRCIGLPRTYVYRGPVDQLRPGVPVPKLRPRDLQRLLGQESRSPNSRVVRKARAEPRE